ncbi:MAG: methylenetetrahydrofolate--tRNA-(uracil(54)-C(5))-methyltransferase (FADH(2)-oxidizing) TrmFO [Oscillospiraceae bacterium]|jgi:methylenetetrahydrofolate--tRNA-(uracil-5-)-methyltransferase|nr:methylenetetrahydrofolate--tRNA-(uracil(54)-C(5))-methyltransferase (FADH(2)-oxidizing) TrmFO [Oscillospiraceae bacterium]
MSSGALQVIGAGLAGCEAAWQASQRGVHVDLFEMKPNRKSPAHHRDDFAELVCSNSFRADRPENAVGLLKEEMRRLGSLIIGSADRSRVPAGGALAVDRDEFSGLVTSAIKNHPLITVHHCEMTEIPVDKTVIIATGPLTDDGMFDSINKAVGNHSLHFFDAAAPIIGEDGIDRGIVFAASRYGKGGDDYLNCPMNEDEYRLFYDALVHAELADVKDFDKETVFEGCMPIETMAKRGYDTIRYGPLKPVGLIDPRIGRMPYACVQLRQDDRNASMFNLVGFQTRLKFSEQERVFRLIPGLQDVEFIRFGVMHRNTYLDSPKVLSRYYSLIENPNVFIAGQITGVEGYVESAGSGLLAGIYAAHEILGRPLPSPLSDKAMLGAMAAYVSDVRIQNFQPMNANFGILPLPDTKIRGKKDRNLAYAQRALEEVERFHALLFQNRD